MATTDVLDDEPTETTELSAAAGPEGGEDSAQAVILDEMAKPYIGRWNRLVSMTNWEKGRIIAQWRTTMIESGSPPAEFSDEAWSRRIGNYTGQHVGRLRRVYERFGTLYEKLDGLFWSHFHAALDWDDAEEWLMKTNDSRWSVAQMRTRRAEELGLAPPASKSGGTGLPIHTAEDDDEESSESAIRGERQSITGDDYDDEDGSKAKRRPDDGEGDDRKPRKSKDSETEDDEMMIAHAAPRTKPAVSFGRLPEDLLDGVEVVKLAILRHKAAKWAEVRRDDVLAALGSLAELCGGDDSEEAPF